MALPSPTNVWKLAKFLLREAPYAIPAGLAYLSDLADAGDESASDVAWVRWHIRGNRATPTGTTEDVAEYKFDLLNITSGAIDTSWTSGDFSTVKTLTDTFVDALRVNQATNYTCTQYRAYAMAYNPSDPGPGLRTAGAGLFAPSGPPVYMATVSKAGLGSGVLPYQVAVTATLKTALPAHWGRIYIPNPSAGTIDSMGRVNSSARTAFADAVHDYVAALADADFLAVVPMGQLAKAPFHALLGVNEVVVDDIPDVQRRRRPKQAAARTIGA